jgi:hypothetical protein
MFKKYRFCLFLSELVVFLKTNTNFYLVKSREIEQNLKGVLQNGVHSFTDALFVIMHSSLVLKLIY